MKAKHGKTLAAAVAAAAMVLGAGGAFAQDYVDVPVTFYDFHSDRSNPEFEQPHGKPSGCGDNSTTQCIRTGMVRNTLGPGNKPVLGPTPYRNYGIDHWFRDWETYLSGPYSKGTNRAPKYTPTPGIRQDYDNEWGASLSLDAESANVGHDTSFKNIVIKDNLRFRLTNAAQNMYEFNETSFFPIDSRGFGREWVSAGDNRNQHNFAFTMEVEFPFQAKKGMVFNFRGDDDVWVFINQKLAMDIGGIHIAQTGSFNISDVLGDNEFGKPCTLRVFYCERHSTGSSILIQTNIVAPPTGVGISENNRNDGTGLVSGKTFEKKADSTKTLYAVVYNDDGSVRPKDQYDCKNVTWTIHGANGTTTKTGCELVVDEKVGKSDGIRIEVSYSDPDAGTLRGNTLMNVLAMEPAIVRIQKTDKPKEANDKNKHDNIYFGPGEKEVKVYAVLYDKYGNFAGYAEVHQAADRNDWSSDGKSAEWVSKNKDVATVNPDRGASVTVTKEFMGEGTSDWLKVTYRVCTPANSPGGSVCDDLVDSVEVGSKSEGQIAVGPNPFTPGGNSIGESLPPKVLDFYSDVINKSGGKGVSGVLIAVDAEGPLEPNGKSKDSYGKIIIYDAVGNVVKTENLYATSRGASYGFVWDGKNAKGRFVGPGTYLVRVTGVVEDGKKAFKFQRMVGVKK